MAPLGAGAPATHRSSHACRRSVSALITPLVPSGAFTLVTSVAAVCAALAEYDALAAMDHLGEAGRLPLTGLLAFWPVFVVDTTSVLVLGVAYSPTWAYVGARSFFALAAAATAVAFPSRPWRPRRRSPGTSRGLVITVVVASLIAAVLS